MSYDILPTHKFEKGIKRLIKKFPSLKKEYADLIIILKHNPKAGTPLGGIVINYVSPLIQKAKEGAAPQGNYLCDG